MFKKFESKKECIDRYIELYKKNKLNELTKDENDEFYYFKDFGKKCKRHKDCISSISYLKNLIEQESDKVMKDVYLYDLAKLEEEKETLQYFISEHYSDYIDDMDELELDDLTDE